MPVVKCEAMDSLTSSKQKSISNTWELGRTVIHWLICVDCIKWVNYTFWICLVDSMTTGSQPKICFWLVKPVLKRSLNVADNFPIVDCVYLIYIHYLSLY